MAITGRQRRIFNEAISIISGVGRGEESTMYGPLRDLFIHLLGYAARSVEIDRRGARGRPDLTVFAPGATAESKVPWIVLEAKEQRGLVANAASRATLFEEKAKYITADTAWFVFVDPTMMVARPAERGGNSAADIEISLSGVTAENFCEVLAALNADVAGVPHRLERFRSGDESIIATDKLSGSGDALAIRIARDAFYDGLGETTKYLQAAVMRAVSATRPMRDGIVADVADFAERFAPISFQPYPISIQGVPRDREEALEYGRAAHELTQRLSENPALARLTLSALPSFANRTGLDVENAEEMARVETFFAIETANLILARILLIRFLEDHSFFDVETPDGRATRRYLCNGGVRAFQGMREYFGQSYTRLLEDAYRSGASIYAAAFNETELDWVLALESDDLSRTVEWAMFRFARYDFTTIRGDILTGVYDRFLDPKQRKDQGEYYTPPSIARWMLDKLGLSETDSVFDPACGSGTFLIERYQQAVGEDAERNLATYADARVAIAEIAGNDLNPFSSVLTQIQLLWHLLAFGDAVRAEGLPTLAIAERANSLVPTILKDQSSTRFGDVDRDNYSAVVGNPPYVRPERGLDLDPAAREYYEESRVVDGVTHEGLSVDRNLYRLFIYRALDHWCANTVGKTGQLAYVIPLGFCSGNDAGDLRRLFAVGGRWTITGIVDLELIWRHVFDADVLPMILFAEARPATVDDVVQVYSAKEDCVLPAVFKGGRPSFDLDQADLTEVGYADLFSPDGRILPRMTPERIAVISKLRRCATLNDAAKPYWTKRVARGQEVSGTRPTGIGEARWEEQRLIKYGLARRGRSETASPGHNLWKGENVRTASITGSPAFTDVDVSSVSSPSVWAYPQILPATMFAIPLIEQIPCAAPFNPSSDAMLNTVVVFGPRADLEDFPFDCLLASRIYGFYSLLNLRASYMNLLRNHIYPSIVAALPWADDLASKAADLVSAKARLVETCERRFEAGAALEREALALGLQSLRSVFRERAPAGSTLIFSDSVEQGEPFTVGTVEVEAEESSWRVFPDAGAREVFIDLPSEELAEYVACGLRLKEGHDLSRNSLSQLNVPSNAQGAQDVDALLDRYQTDALEAAVEAEVDSIDAIVGPLLGLTDSDLTFIQQQMKEDPFLSRVRPRYPFFTPKQRGRRTNLERADRYRAG